jgi:excisionase family DNA binding protein
MSSAPLFLHEGWLTHHDVAYIFIVIGGPEPQESMFMADEVMTKQAADDLNVTLPTRERRPRAGIIPVVTFGSRMLLRKERLDALLRAHEPRWASTAAAEVATSGLPAGEG